MCHCSVSRVFSQVFPELTARLPSRPSAATKNRVLHGFAGNSFTGHAYARLACCAPSRGAATSCSLGRQPQGSDARKLLEPRRGDVALPARAACERDACTDVAPAGAGATGQEVL